LTSQIIWIAAAVLFGLCVIHLLRTEGLMDAEGNQIGNVRRARRIAILGMILAAALVVLGFAGSYWWQ
jgi:hypothetical protein